MFLTTRSWNFIPRLSRPIELCWSEEREFNAVFSRRTSTYMKNFFVSTEVDPFSIDLFVYSKSFTKNERNLQEPRRNRETSSLYLLTGSYQKMNTCLLLFEFFLSSLPRSRVILASSHGWRRFLQNNLISVFTNLSFLIGKSDIKCVSIHVKVHISSVIVFKCDRWHHSSDERLLVFFIRWAND